MGSTGTDVDCLGIRPNASAAVLRTQEFIKFIETRRNSVFNREPEKTCGRAHFFFWLVIIF